MKFGHIHKARISQYDHPATPEFWVNVYPQWQKETWRSRRHTEKRRAELNAIVNKELGCAPFYRVHVKMKEA